jgi:hypothetical protein
VFCERIRDITSERVSGSRFALGSIFGTGDGIYVNGGAETSHVAAQKSATLGRCDQALETG